MNPQNLKENSQIHKTITEPTSKLVPIHRLKSKHKQSLQFELKEGSGSKPYFLSEVVSEGHIRNPVGSASGRLINQKKLSLFQINKESRPSHMDSQVRLQVEPITPLPKTKKPIDLRRIGSFSDNLERFPREKHSLSQLDPLSPLRVKEQ